ncbi:unnamed protein product [Leptidea sinapis]|uniref:H15 domain-containing protein n=1 Tax=Leptidea sinapis TaxID=189913 RepID=A0A5E4QXI4_9NEOP|nr:unnamed protein product [Leptidea sinapis]
MDMLQEIVMHTKPSKKTAKKQPISPTAELLDQQNQKITTKQMVNKALTDLQSRKGTSLYAIKKYIEVNYNVDIHKRSYIIRKYLKKAVESGLVTQIQGSFRLVPTKSKAEKKKAAKKTAEKLKAKRLDEESRKSPKKHKDGDTKKITNNKKEKVKKRNESKKELVNKSDSTKEKVKKSDKNTEKKSEKGVKNKKEKKLKKTSAKENKDDNEEKVSKKVRIKSTISSTPGKKRSGIVNRRSIGSIIKRPKMKPGLKPKE